MRVSSLICEYNPFHNGHKYMIEKMRENGCEYIIACMSGNFTQRGDFAVFDKYSRTKTALENGIDLVIELPVIYSCATAEKFAFGGVDILNSLGCVNEIYFGSECGNMEALRNTADILQSSEISEKIKKYLSLGQTFAKARENAVADIDKISAEILKSPNNILGIEYIKALNKINSPILPQTIQRVGSEHDSLTVCENTASATLIRKMIYENNQEFKKYIPSPVFSEIHDFKKLETAVLYKLRMMSLEDFKNLPDISEGLENRLYSAVRNGTSIEQILSLAKTKRYTLARLRRILLYAFLGITQNDCHILPQYIKILGFSQNGKNILRTMRETAKLPVIMRYSDVKKLSPSAQYLYALESRCDDIYALSGENIIPCGRNLTENTVLSVNHA